VKSLKNEIFNSLLLADDLDRLEESGISVQGASPPKEASITAPDFSPRIMYSSEKMADLYRLFFCLENDARALIRDRLQSLHGSNWFETKVPRKIRDEVEKIKKREEKNKYHVQRSGDSIGYTMFGNLSQIIIANWEDFTDLFPDQAWVTSRFSDLELSRNIIMHTNELPDIEADRIVSIVRDWKAQVG